jgi:phosphoglycerate dehydrogenase-like enzyme
MSATKLPEVRIISKTILDEKRINEISKLSNLKADKDNVKRGDREELLKRIGNAEIVLFNSFTHIPDDVLKECSTLKYLISTTAGINQVNVKTCEELGITVKHFPGYCAQTIAEKTLGYIIFGFNKIIPAIQNVKDGNWHYARFQGRELHNKNLCVLGMGAIGNKVAKLCKTVGMNILGVNSTTPRDEVTQYLKEADAISINMSLNESTKNFFNKESLKLLKKDVILINSGRGGHIVEEDLADYLNQNPNAHAFLDVLCDEPMKADNPLKNLSNVTITPHIAWNSKEAYEELMNQSYQMVRTAIAECRKIS